MNRKNKKEISPWRASRQHYGPHHWHVEIRSSVIVCRQCKTKIAKWQRPESCPGCGAGSHLN